MADSSRLPDLERAYDDFHPGLTPFAQLSDADRDELTRRYTVAKALDAAHAGTSMQRLVNANDASRVMEAGMTSAPAVLAVISFVPNGATHTWERPDLLPEALHQRTADWLARGTRIAARGDDAATGTLTGARSACRLEGCTGVRVSVKWDDGSRTRPCSKGLKRRNDGTLQIH